MDNEEPHDNRPLEDKSTDEIGDHPDQIQEPISINYEKNSESEEEQFEAENNEESIPDSEANNVQIENAGEENSAKAIKKSRLKLILPLYFIGLISLSAAAFGFCFASFTEYAYTQYKFIVTRNFQWIWICAILAAIIFLVDLITLFILKGTKRVSSLKRLLFARFSIPFVASVIICIIVGLVGGKAYYNRIDANYKADNFYINEALQQENGNSDSSTDNLSASLMPSHTASDAVVAVTLAATCTKYETKSQISNDDLAFFNNSGNGGPAILVGGTTPLDPIMNCIIQELHMPSSVETELKAAIAQVVSVLQENQNSNLLTKLSGLPSINTSWNLKDGSTIYLSYGPPAIPLGSWSALIGVTKSILSETSSSPSESSTNANGNSNSSSINSNATNQESSYQNALMAIDSTTTVCSNYETQNEISNNDLSFVGPAGGGPVVNVSGTNAWDPMMTCVAQELHMPSSVETELKAAIAQAVLAIEGKSKISFSDLQQIYTSWNLSDGSKIYLGYSGPADPAGSWGASFGITSQKP